MTSCSTHHGRRIFHCAHQMRGAAVGAAVAISLLPHQCASATERLPDPVSDVRTLAVVQNTLVAGQRGGLSVQRRLIRDMGKRFLEAPPETWAQPRAADAGIRYLLSGGDPRFARNPVVRLAMPEDRRDLFDAAHNYVEGRLRRARDAFRQIDVRTLNPAVAGHAALVKGQLLAATDVTAAWQSLEDARLHGLGTLIEEAALRRLMGLRAAPQHPKYFQRISENYLRRYEPSVFSDGFRLMFAEHAARYAGHDETGFAAWMARMIRLVRMPRRLSYCVAVSRQALAHGRATVVRTISALAHALPRHAGTGDDWRRMRLYSLVNQAAAGELDGQHAGLARLEPDPGAAFDRGLWLGARAVSRTVLMEPEAPRPETSLPVQADTSHTKQRPWPGDSTIRSAQDVLRVAETLLQPTRGDD